MPISPLHVLFYQSSRKSKNVQISIFFCFIQFSVNFLFIVPMLHLQLHFRLSFSGGLGNTPTSGICGIVFIQCTPIPCLMSEPSWIVQILVTAILTLPVLCVKHGYKLCPDLDAPHVPVQIAEIIPLQIMD